MQRSIQCIGIVEVKVHIICCYSWAIIVEKGLTHPLLTFDPYFSEKSRKWVQKKYARSVSFRVIWSPIPLMACHVIFGPS